MTKKYDLLSGIRNLYTKLNESRGTDLSDAKPTNLKDEKTKIFSSVIIPWELASRVKHPECVEKIVAVLDNEEMLTGSDILGINIHKLKEYQIHYKVGPCRKDCSSLIPEIQEKGCYNGRISVVTREQLHFEKLFMGSLD